MARILILFLALFVHAVHAQITVTGPTTGGGVDHTAKITFTGGSVNDDDCTGEQGIMWWDATDSAFEWCNANSGVPDTLGSGGGSATNVRHSLTRWLSPDGLYSYADIFYNVGTQEQTFASRAAVMRFASETTTSSARTYWDGRDFIPTDASSNISFKIDYINSLTTGNYRWVLYWAALASGENAQLSENLVEGSLATHVFWDTTGDFDDTGGNADYQHSTGAGTLTLPSADFAVTATANTWYNLCYTTTNVAGGGPSCTVTTAFAAAAVTLNVDENATTCDQFVSAASPGDFVISCTSGASDRITFDDLSLRPMFVESIGVTDTVDATAWDIDTVEFTPSGTVSAGDTLIWRLELDYTAAANTADAIANVLDFYVEYDQ